MARVLVTGGTGFIGSHVVRALLARGDDVRVTVRGAARQDPLAGLDVDRVVADITDRAAMRRAVKGVERVFHVAGTTNLRWSAEQLLRINAEGTRTVLDACLAGGVQRVVHVSSVAAIGPARPGGALDERHVRGGPLGIPYADAKRAAEAEALRVAAQGLDVVIACPVRLALALAEASARTPGPTLVTTAEIRAAAHWWTYRSAKARRELGWTTRAHEDTVEATVRFHQERLGDRLLPTGTRQPLPWRLAGRAAKVLP